MIRVKTSFIKILLVLLVPLLFAACENSTENKNPQPVNTEVFPNKVGDMWEYAVHDSISGSVDTLIVRIVGTTTGGGKSLSIWVRKSNAYNDTLYVNINNDTVNFYSDSYAIFVDHKIVFPLKVGSYWKNPTQISDSSMVTNQESVTVPASTFPDTYRIERNWTSFNIHGYSLSWFEANVGIVKMYMRIQGFDNIKETWELLSYTVL